MSKFFHPDDFKNIYSHIEDQFSPAAVDNSRLYNRVSAADIANAKVSKLTEQNRIMKEALTYVAGRGDWNWENVDNQWKWLNEFTAVCREALAKVKEI